MAPCLGGTHLDLGGHEERSGARELQVDLGHLRARAEQPVRERHGEMVGDSLQAVLRADLRHPID
jgi:hypothetical protein